MTEREGMDALCEINMALTDRICWLTGACSVLLQIAETAREGRTLDAGQLEAMDRVKRGYEERRWSNAEAISTIGDHAG